MKSTRSSNARLGRLSERPTVHDGGSSACARQGLLVVLPGLVAGLLCWSGCTLGFQEEPGPPALAVAALAPTRGFAGDVVLVSLSGVGERRVDQAQVRFGGVQARVLEAGADGLRVEVPAGASPGPVTAIIGETLAVSPQRFDYLGEGHPLLRSVQQTVDIGRSPTELHCTVSGQLLALDGMYQMILQLSADRESIAAAYPVPRGTRRAAMAHEDGHVWLLHNDGSVSLASPPEGWDMAQSMPYLVDGANGASGAAAMEDLAADHDQGIAVFYSRAGLRLYAAMVDRRVAGASGLLHRLDEEISKMPISAAALGQGRFLVLDRGGDRVSTIQLTAIGGSLQAERIDDLLVGRYWTEPPDEQGLERSWRSEVSKVLVQGDKVVVLHQREFVLLQLGPDGALSPLDTGEGDALLDLRELPPLRDAVVSTGGNLIFLIPAWDDLLYVYDVEARELRWPLPLGAVPMDAVLCPESAAASSELLLALQEPARLERFQADSGFPRGSLLLASLSGGRSLLVDPGGEAIVGSHQRLLRVSLDSGQIALGSWLGPERSQEGDAELWRSAAGPALQLDPFAQHVAAGDEPGEGERTSVLWVTQERLLASTADGAQQLGLPGAADHDLDLLAAWPEGRRLVTHHKATGGRDARDLIVLRDEDLGPLAELQVPRGVQELQVTPGGEVVLAKVTLQRWELLVVEIRDDQLGEPRTVPLDASVKWLQLLPLANRDAAPEEVLGLAWTGELDHPEALFFRLALDQDGSLELVSQPQPPGPPCAMAVLTPDRRRLICGARRSFDGLIFMQIDPELFSQPTVTGTLALPAPPDALTVTPDGGRLLVTTLDDILYVVH